MVPLSLAVRLVKPFIGPINISTALLPRVYTLQQWGGGGVITILSLVLAESLLTELEALESRHRAPTK